MRKVQWIIEAKEVIKLSLSEAVLFPKYKKIERLKIELKVLFIRVYFLLLIELKEEFPFADRIIVKFA